MGFLSGWCKRFRTKWVVVVIQHDGVINSTEFVHLKTVLYKANLTAILRDDTGAGKSILNEFRFCLIVFTCTSSAECAANATLSSLIT